MVIVYLKQTFKKPERYRNAILNVAVLLYSFELSRSNDPPKPIFKKTAFERSNTKTHPLDPQFERKKI